MRKPLSRIQGFTLLELLVVVALMAIVATVALVANDGVQDEAAVDATKYEMAELRKALLQFRRDTGVFPNQGAIYSCEALQSTLRDSKGAVAWPSGAPTLDTSTTSNWVKWCRSPANFWMLFMDPLGRAPEDQWDPDSKRGWKGPYLSRSGPMYVDVGSVDLSADSEKSGSILVNLRGISDKFDHPPVTVGGNLYLAWKLVDDGAALDSNGRPYLLMQPDSSNARIVSMGPDGGYDGMGATPCVPPLDADDKPLDLVLCLLQ